VSEFFVKEEKNRIVSELLEAKNNRDKAYYRNYSNELTMPDSMNISDWLPDDFKKELSPTILSEEIKVSKKMIRRFERDKSYMPAVSFVFK